MTKRKILILILLISGTLLILYPNVSILFSSFEQASVVEDYKKSATYYDKELVKKERKRAKEYNKSIAGAEVHDPFVPGSGIVIPTDYDGILNVSNGIMGTLEIPKIGLELPIYHGISEDVLQKGVGHLKETAFPIGGKENHVILSTHRGLPKAKLFTDLDKLDIGDLFYITIYDEILAYRVDQIKVIEPKDTKYLIPIEDKDLVTLLTCTPYGINSHRLVVRGSRTKYIPTEKEAIKNTTSPMEVYLIIASMVGFICLLKLYWKYEKKRGEKAKCENG